MAGSAFAPWRILCAAIAATVLAHDAAPAADYELLSAVVVSRHGVRSPIATGMPLAEIAADPWPAWPTAHPGDLTERGAELAKLMGAYYRDYYVVQGLFPAQSCPTPDTVVFWADVDQRTKVTAQALSDGMFPGCGIQPGHLADAKADPLFHPPRAGVCTIDAELARRSVMRRIGSLRRLQSSVRPEIAAMQAVLKCCAPALCRPTGAAACKLGDLQTELVAHGDEGVWLRGPISIGSMAGEVFLLQYAQNMPAEQVAWGRVRTQQALRPLMRLHTLRFDLMNRTPYLAAREGSALVERIVSTFRRFLSTGGASSPKLTVLVGHDTNISQIGGMLGLHWSLPSYLPDQTPPAGALHFELLRERRTGLHSVRVSYVAQTPDQMRQATPLDRSRRPERSVARIDDCRTGRAGCPWPRFARLAERSIDRACVPVAR